MSLGALQYIAVTWTTGDIATETKMDNMVNNDQAYDSRAAQGILLNNDVGYYQKDSGGTNREILNLDANDDIIVGGGGTTNDHVVLKPGNAELVKMQVLRQDDTSDSYVANQVILTGWGFFTTSGSNKRESGAVSFGITFDSAPVVVTGSLGYKATDPTAIGDFAAIAGNIGDIGITLHGYGVTTSGFSVQIIRESANMTDGWRIGYSWTAIGTLA